MKISDDSPAVAAKTNATPPSGPKSDSIHENVMIDAVKVSAQKQATIPAHPFRSGKEVSRTISVGSTRLKPFTACGILSGDPSYPGRSRRGVYAKAGTLVGGRGDALPKGADHLGLELRA
jgi:hypothetical protein